ncbi:MAG: SPOR domain-containing protein [Dysgonamonadaceae bacterium]|nr:SPOR domain-containing protein [Dysgonamonadaceae bacterium]
METSIAGEGTVRIVCDPKIIELLGIPASSTPPEISDETQTVKLNGYRIQVYMDNSQMARNEASRIVGLMNESFPEVATYVRYNAPNWRVLAGDFQTKEEADIFKQTIQSSLPELGKEMYIVPSKINSPVSYSPAP